MRVSRLVLSFLLILASSLRLNSQQSTTAPQTDPQAILYGCATTMGASSAELPIIAQGVLTVGAVSESQTIVIKTLGPRLFRQDQTGTSGVETWVVNNGIGFRSRANQREDLSSHVTRYFRPDHLPASSCAPDLNRFDVTFEGLQQVLNKPTYHLRLVAKPTNPRTKSVEAILSEYHLYIDQQTFLVLKTSTFVFSPNIIQNRSTWETFYGDYRKVGGVLVPFHIENYLSGQKLRDITFSDVQVGVSLSNADFE